MMKYLIEFKKRLFIHLLLLTISSNTLAATHEITVRFSVTEKSCDVYGENGKGFPISVKFRPININHFNSDNYVENIIYHLDCGSSFENSSLLKMSFISDAISINSESLIATTNTNVGLQLFANNQKVAPNEYFNFIYGNKPILNVKPIINTAQIADIDLGDFTAFGTISIDYD